MQSLQADACSLHNMPDTNAAYSEAEVGHPLVQATSQLPLHVTGEMPGLHLGKLQGLRVQNKPTKNCAEYTIYYIAL